MNDLEPIIRKIYVIRGQRVMLDKDLAELYGVTTGNLNKAVKRNIRRFPPDFMFQLTKEEWDSLRFQIGIMNTPERPEIGYVAVQKQREKSQYCPSRITKLNKNNSQAVNHVALHHTAFRRMSRVDMKDLITDREKIISN